MVDWFPRIFFGFVAVPAYEIQRAAFLRVSVTLVVDLMIGTIFHHMFSCFVLVYLFHFIIPVVDGEDDFRFFMFSGFDLKIPFDITSFCIAAVQISQVVGFSR